MLSTDSIPISMVGQSDRSLNATLLRVLNLSSKKGLELAFGKANWRSVDVQTKIDPMAQKKKRIEIREEMSLIISNLDQRWLDAASGEVCQRLADLIASKAGKEFQHFLAFLPFFRGEADLTQLIVEQLGHRRVYLPRITGERAMDFVEINKDWIRHLERGFFDIPGPRADSGAVFDLAEAAEALVLVPGLAFDRWGNWLGRVSGYYNKFFARKGMREATKVGVCWELQMVPDLPADHYQVNLDWVCHERDLIRTAPQFDEDLADE